MRRISSLLLFLVALGSPSISLSALSVQSSEFTSSAVADATEKLIGRRAHMTSEIRLLAGTRIAGPAITLRLVRDDKASATQTGLAVIKLLEAAPAGSVVVAVLEDEKGFAVFGGSFAALAKARNLAGFVVDGAVRDLTELKRLGFPTLARGTAAGSAGGHYRLEGANIPVTCGGIEVRPGDYVVADDDGVAVAPKEHYQEVLTLAKSLQIEEQRLLPLIEKHGSYLKALQERGAAKRQQ
jgi:4-hydroxy-4-methyl-2-oxoglutarate aldolase